MTKIESHFKRKLKEHLSKEKSEFQFIITKIEGSNKKYTGVFSLGIKSCYDNQLLQFKLQTAIASIAY